MDMSGAMIGQLIARWESRAAGALASRAMRFDRETLGGLGAGASEPLLRAAASLHATAARRALDSGDAIVSEVTRGIDTYA